MKKQQFDPNKFKFLFSLFISITLTIFVILSLSVFARKTYKENTLKQDESYHFIAEGYSQSITYCMENYYSLLNRYNVAELFTDTTPEEIQNTFISHKTKICKDFNNIFFVLPDGNAYPINGIPFNASVYEYYRQIVKNGKEFWTTSIFADQISGNYVIAIAEKVYDTNNNFAGILGATIPITALEEYLLQVKIGEQGEFLLQDSNGYFIVHPQKGLLFTAYVPVQTSKIKAYSSKEISNLPEGRYTSVSYDGEPIFLYTSKVDETEWTVEIAIPKKQIDEAYILQQKMTVIIFIIFVVVMLLLLALEAYTINIFQKKQLLTTLYDPLTNLWTRPHFENEANKLLRHYQNSKFMLIECDIRGFKFINQNYGEEEADRLIVYFSKLLLRYTKEANGILGRGFADHFYIFIRIASVHQAMNLFKETTRQLGEEIKQYEIPFFPKFGIAFLVAKNKTKDSTIQSLIGQASFAKSTIKDNMLTPFSIYNSKLLDKINDERYIEAHMQEGLENNEFFVMYQPKYSLVTEQVVGAEALVRWNNPKIGLMTPDAFIPLFERNGFIKKLDFFVYEEVFKFLQNRLLNNEPVVPISINMSRNHSKPDRFMHDFMAIFKKYSIPPKFIQIEILERSVMDNSTLKEITELLHKEGFTVAMDDFGSGESSLNMLTQIPVDVLKFDRTFLVSSTLENGKMNKNSADFIETLIKMSKSLKKQTIFEGVETKAQRDFLKNIECDQVQGFFYSRPLTADDFAELINSQGTSEQ